MLTWFSNMKVGVRVLIGMLVPVLGLAFYASVSMVEKFGDSRELMQAGALAKFSPTVSALLL
mgnify:FL=1